MPKQFTHFLAFFIKAIEVHKSIIKTWKVAIIDPNVLKKFELLIDPLIRDPYCFL